MYISLRFESSSESKTAAARDEPASERKSEKKTCTHSSEKCQWSLSNHSNNTLTQRQRRLQAVHEHDNKTVNLESLSCSFIFYSFHYLHSFPDQRPRSGLGLSLGSVLGTGNHILLRAMCCTIWNSENLVQSTVKGSQWTDKRKMRGKSGACWEAQVESAELKSESDTCYFSCSSCS